LTAAAITVVGTYATALRTEEINKLRPPGLQIIVLQIDARLWTHYHDILAAPYDANEYVLKQVAALTCREAASRQH